MHPWLPLCDRTKDLQKTSSPKLPKPRSPVTGHSSQTDIPRSTCGPPAHRAVHLSALRGSPPASRSAHRSEALPQPPHHHPELRTTRPPQSDRVLGELKPARLGCVRIASRLETAVTNADSRSGRGDWVEGRCKSTSWGHWFEPSTVHFGFAWQRENRVTLRVRRVGEDAEQRGWFPHRFPHGNSARSRLAWQLL